MADLETKILELEKKIKQFKEKQKKDNAAKNLAERKKRTRQAILIGTMMLNIMEKNEDTKQRIFENLKVFLTKKNDRALFEFEI